MSEAVIYTQEQLEERCRVWQERLRLQDWIVKPRIQPHYKLGTAQGVAGMSVERKEAYVYILDAGDYGVDDGFLQDMEETLVHELCHLHFEPLGVERDSPKHVAEEQAVQCIASSLVKAWRRVEELEQKQSEPKPVPPIEAYHSGETIALQRGKGSKPKPDTAGWVNEFLGYPVLIDDSIEGSSIRFATDGRHGGVFLEHGRVRAGEEIHSMRVVKYEVVSTLNNAPLPSEAAFYMNKEMFYRVQKLLSKEAA